MKEIVRKICLVVNWVALGGLGIFLSVGGLFSDDTGLISGLGFAALVLAFIVHKTINWIFA